jgi:two-component sensor histidine kinase
MVNAASSITQDITERHKAEQAVENALAEKEVLLKEIQHRVKNNMQVMISLLQMQSLRVKDPVDAKLFKDSQERIRSMALVYERLHQSSDLSRISLKHYVTSLVTGLVHSYNLSPVTPRTIIDVPDIPVSLDIAIPCGLIINEVISNSLKYAFPDDRCGTIRLKIEYTNPKMVLTMADDGIGLPEKVIVGRTSSMGMQLIFSLVEHQLGGKIKLDRSGGTRYEIVFSTAERRS